MRASLLHACALLLLSTAAAQLSQQHPPQRQQQQAKSPWLLHDPGFPVDVRVSPFGDESWTEARIKAQDASEVLRVPSSLLNITVVLPELRNLTDVQVIISLFKPTSPPSSSSGGGDTDTQSSSHSNNAHNGEEEEAFKAIADTQVQYAKSYRLDVRHIAGQLVVRVYVEGNAGRLGDDTTAAVKARAFFVRTIDLRASEAQYYICDSDTNSNSDSEDDTTTHHYSFPPVNMPRHLCKQFTMGGKVPVRQWYFDDQTDTDSSYTARSFEFIEALIEKARRRERFYYGVTDDFLYEALAKYGIAGKHVLIVGSTTPWYESVCVALEAASCTTIDYNKLRYDHPKLKTFTLAEFAAIDENESEHERKHFDVILSISSFEHDGLGRYGDPLAPDADLETMKSLLQYANPKTSEKSTTKLFLAVPVGPDCVVWNAQRVYGSLRLPLLVESWKLIDSFGFQKSDFAAPFTVGHQPVFVLEPPDEELHEEDNEEEEEPPSTHSDEL